MRDLKRSNARQPAYKLFEALNMECFTPKVEKLFVEKGRRVRRMVPFMQDLLFVRDTRRNIDRVVEKTPTLQYRYILGVSHTPMIVKNAEMECFIRAVQLSESPHYYAPGEITVAMRNRKIRIIGGHLDGYEGYLITTRGSKVKRLLVEIPALLAATVEVQPEYIQLI